MADLRIGIIGVGAVGATLAKALNRNKNAVVSLIDLDYQYIQALAKQLGIKRYSNRISDLPSDLDLVIISVPDENISDVAEHLNSISTERHFKCCLHTSGFYDKTVLSSLSAKKISVGSLHPLQSFPSRDSETDLKGVYFAVEGDEEAIKRARELVSILGGESRELPEGAKKLYHAAAVISGNFIPVLQQTALDILSEAAISEADGLKMLKLLATTSLNNCFNFNPANSLTGPIARGDLNTVRDHLEVLKMYTPDLLGLYIEISKHALDLAHKKGTDPTVLEKIRALLIGMEEKS